MDWFRDQVGADSPPAREPAARPMLETSAHITGWSKSYALFLWKTLLSPFIPQKNDIRAINRSGFDRAPNEGLACPVLNARFRIICSAGYMGSASLECNRSGCIIPEICCSLQ